jgi:hypothetical protein
LKGNGAEAELVMVEIVRVLFDFSLSDLQSEGLPDLDILSAAVKRLLGAWRQWVLRVEGDGGLLCEPLKERLMSLRSLVL